MHRASLRLGQIKEKFAGYNHQNDPDVVTIWLSRTGAPKMKDADNPVVEDIQNLSAILYGLGKNVEYFYHTVVVDPSGKVILVEQGPPGGQGPFPKTKPGASGLLHGLKLPDGDVGAQILKHMRFGELDELEARAVMLCRHPQFSEFGATLLERVRTNRAGRIAAVRGLMEAGEVAEARAEIQALLDAWPRNREVLAVLKDWSKLLKNPEARDETAAAAMFLKAMDMFRTDKSSAVVLAARQVAAVAAKYPAAVFGKLALMLEEQRLAVAAKQD